MLCVSNLTVVSALVLYCSVMAGVVYWTTPSRRILVRRRVRVYVFDSVRSFVAIRLQHYNIIEIDTPLVHCTTAQPRRLHCTTAQPTRLHCTTAQPTRLHCTTAQP
eukprot:Lankesteria_metandrocarpae@DN3144_c0_g1_i1.p1